MARGGAKGRLCGKEQTASHSSTSKLVHPEVSSYSPLPADKRPLQSQGIGKSSPAPYLSPYPLRRGVILIQTNCLKPHFLLPSRVELMTRCARRRRHVDPPISRPSRALRENKGAARSAPKARAIRWEKPGSESGTDPARSSIEHLRGEVGVGGFIPICHEESEPWKR